MQARSWIAAYKVHFLIRDLVEINPGGITKISADKTSILQLRCDGKGITDTKEDIYYYFAGKSVCLSVAHCG